MALWKMLQNLGIFILFKRHFERDDIVQLSLAYSWNKSSHLCHMKL